MTETRCTATACFGMGVVCDKRADDLRGMEELSMKEVGVIVAPKLAKRVTYKATGNRNTK